VIPENIIKLRNNKLVFLSTSVGFFLLFLSTKENVTRFPYEYWKI